MNLIHKFIDDLEALENHRTFCNKPLEKELNVLIIGTFNPNDNSISKPNNSTWFYGREESKFWQYMPECIDGTSLKTRQSEWKNFCVTNKIVIVDLLKSINNVSQLTNFKDKSLEERIDPNLNNVQIFDFEKAFAGIHFQKVIYTRKTWLSTGEFDPIPNLVRIRKRVDDTLLNLRIVESESNIKSCYTPWKDEPHVKEDWCSALMGFRVK